MSTMPAGSQTSVCTSSVEVHAARAFGEQCEHHVAAVVVGEPFAGRGHGLVPVQDRQVLLGRRELVHRHRHHVVGDVADGGLVEVVADPGAVRQQVLDRHVVGDQGQVLAEQRAGRGAELERPALDQAHHRQRGQALGSARGGEQVSGRCWGSRGPGRRSRTPWRARSRPRGRGWTTPENPVRSAAPSTSSPGVTGIASNLASGRGGTPGRPGVPPLRGRCNRHKRSGTTPKFGARLGFSAKRNGPPAGTRR